MYQTNAHFLTGADCKQGDLTASKEKEQLDTTENLPQAKEAVLKPEKELQAKQLEVASSSDQFEQREKDVVTQKGIHKPAWSAHDGNDDYNYDDRVCTVVYSMQIHVHNMHVHVL